ncbi:FecR domain-containing protein [Cohaesibacter intestini]|uniref:FecR domain-containing protein n=1 Tax=Cohaesibacter intestini TaxID=2211145 RepID=UPI000DE93218|nr:FecR domain-containing protein [Cohaesibacter intestini]
MRSLILCIAVLFAFLAPQTAMSQDEHSWMVTKVTGSAYIAAKHENAQRVKRGMMLRPGQTLSTHAKTRIMLKRGKERIQVGPSAIMAIPPARYNEAGKTTILHQSGRLDLTVNKRDVRHFSVRTPFLVAVVKGTTFAVNVNGRGARVSVSEGTVGVSDHQSGESADITRGQQASVRAVNGTSTGLTLKAATPAATRALNLRKTKQRKSKANFRATRKVSGVEKTLEPGSLKTAKASKQTVGKDKASRNLRTGKMTAAQKRAAAKRAYAERVKQWALAVQRNPRLSLTQKKSAAAKAAKAESAAASATASANSNSKSNASSNANANSSSNASSNANANSSNNSSNNSSSNSSNNSSNNSNSNSSNNSSNNSNSNSSNNSSNNSSSNNGKGNS